MLRSAEGEIANKPGDTFVVHMDRDSLRDFPLDLYDVTVSFTRFEPNRAIEWTILAGFLDPPLGHVYGYELEPTDGGTKVTSYYDWSALREVYRGRIGFPIISENALAVTTITPTRHSLVGSMGQVGAAGDNAAMESFFALLQKNVLDRRRWTQLQRLATEPEHRQRGTREPQH